MMNGKGVLRPSGARWRIAMRTLLVFSLLVFASGCAGRVHYLTETEKIVHLNGGDPAPHAGWLLSDDYLADIYDVIGMKLPDNGPVK
jgi:hypothetical protein